MKKNMIKKIILLTLGIALVICGNGIATVNADDVKPSSNIVTSVDQKDQYCLFTYFYQLDGVDDIPDAV